MSAAPVCVVSEMLFFVKYLSADENNRAFVDVFVEKFVTLQPEMQYCILSQGRGAICALVKC